jgi:hypothetical protein
VPFRPPSIPLTEMNPRQQAEYFTAQGIQATGGGSGGGVQTFTPTWLDFSSDPAGTFSYMDLGDIVIMWTDASRTGTSDDVFMRWDAGSIPASIRPSASRVIPCYVLDNVSTLKGSVVIAADGSATFSILQVSGIQLADVGNNFSSPGVPKGLLAGWLVMYPK